MLEEIVNLDINIEDLDHVSEECKDIILGLLEKDPERRIGSKHGFEEIMHHPFFKIPSLTVQEYWSAVIGKYFPPPSVLVPCVD